MSEDLVQGRSVSGLLPNGRVRALCEYRVVGSQAPSNLTARGRPSNNPSNIPSNPFLGTVALLGLGQAIPQLSKWPYIARRLLPFRNTTVLVLLRNKVGSQEKN